MAKRKGLEPIQWAFITIAATLVIVVFAVNPLQAAIDQAIANSAELTAERLRSAINLMQIIPGNEPGSTHAVNILGKESKIKIDKKSVTVEIGYNNVTINLIQRDDVSIEPAKIDTKTWRKIVIKRIENIMQFT